VAHLLIKVPWLIYRRARWMPVLFHPELPKLLKLMGPRMLGMGVTYVGFVLPTTFGSLLAEGAVSAYEYGWKLMQLPETVLGTAMGIVVFPTLAKLAEDREGLRHTFSWALRLIVTFSIPAAVGLLLLGRPLIVLIFQRGAFDAAATDRVFWGLQFFALGLVTHSALEVVARLFYARRDMWTPFGAAVAGLAVNAGLGWLLLPTLAHGAIALSNGLGAGLQVVILLLVARRRLDGIDGRVLGGTLLRVGLASAVMAAAVAAFEAWLAGVEPQVAQLALWLAEMTGFYPLFDYAHLLVSGVGGLVVGGGVYVLAALLLGSREIRRLPGLFARKR
jgi:putative peptidoglycan lipid II flippase